MIFIMLENWSDRQSPEMSVPNLVTRLNNAVKTIPEAKVIFFTPPSVPGFGSAVGFEVQLLDKKSGEIASFGKHADEFVSKLNNHPAIAFASQSFNDDFPQYELSLDIERIKEAGFTADQVFLALQGYLGGIYVTNFSEFGKQYKVMVQSHPKYRDEVSDLEAIYVKNHSGVSSPVTNFINLKRVYGPQSLNRFNLYNAISINGGAAKGYSSGEAIDAVQTIAKTDLPDQYDIAFSGISLEEIKSEGQSQIILILSIVFVYFFLAAQFESFFLPLAVLFSLVVGIAGAFITTKLTGLELNIYFNIALVMLVGLLAKNAILIVEYAQQYFEQGNSIFHSAMRAAKLRLRPILMTSMAFVVGLLPLVFANGVGEHGNNSIGTGAAGGMFIGTLIGLLIIPILYWLFQNIHVWIQQRLSKEEI
jgi:HAE1 family hydrophobic/amphiphilic exporter-1